MHQRGMLREILSRKTRQNTEARYVPQNEERTHSHLGFEWHKHGQLLAVKPFSLTNNIGNNERLSPVAYFGLVLSKFRGVFFGVRE